MILKLFFLICLLRSVTVTASSALAILSAENTSNSGLSDLSWTMGDKNDKNKKELVDRVKDLELQFQLHVSESKAEREDQYEKITILKAAKKTQQEKFQLVLNEIEVLKSQNQDQTARIVQLEEILQTKIATSSIQSSSSALQPDSNDGSTIPSSCEDLKSSGHNLNGIYMVFDANIKKVLATYCNFRQSSTTTIEQKIIGSLGINTLVGGVYFYAQMKTTFKEVGRTVPFDRILMNQGNGLSTSNKGVFTAPRAGIYHFTFKGNTRFNINFFIIEIRHNGVVVGDTTTNVALLHVHATLKLKAGDRVYLFKTTAGELFTDFETPDTHFSGWLMEEDVSLL